MRVERGQHVTLNLEGFGPIGATVDAAPAATVTLVLLSPPEPRLRRLGLTPAEIVFTSPRGVHRLSGLLERDHTRPEVLHLHQESLDTEQRREWVRVGAVLPVKVTVLDADGVRYARTTALNVSGGGLLISDPLGLPVDATVELELVLDEHAPPLRASASVARVEDKHAGLLLQGLAPADRERIVRFVTSRQRIELRLARGRA